MNNILVVAKREIYEQLWLKKSSFIINIIILIFISSILFLKTLSFVPNPTSTDLSTFLYLALFIFPLIFGIQIINNYSVEPFYFDKTKGNLELLIALQIPIRTIFLGKIIAISILVLLTLILLFAGLLLVILISYNTTIIRMIFHNMTFPMYIQLFINIPFIIFCLTAIIGLLFWKFKDIRLISIAIFALFISCFFLFNKFINIISDKKILLFIIAQIIISLILLLISFILINTIKSESLLKKV